MPTIDDTIYAARGPLCNHPITESFADWSHQVDGKKFLEQLSRHAYRVCNYAAVSENYRSFYQHFGDRGTIHFAVKASAEPYVLKTLIALGAGFEIATYSELRLLIECGLPKSEIGKRVNFGQTQKERSDIRKALQDGLRNFATDNIHDIRIITELAGELQLDKQSIRLQIRLFNAAGSSFGEGYSQSFNKRYGVDNEQAMQLAESILATGMTLAGFTFHPGSGSNAPDLWDYGIRNAAKLSRQLKETLRISVSELNLSGGFHPSVPIETYSQHIFPLIEQIYTAEGADLPEHIDTEPGRWLVANAEVLIGKVSNIKINRDGTRIITMTTGVSENGTLTDLGLDFDFFILENAKARKLEKRPELRGNLHGRACADFDVIAEHTAVPAELHPDNPLADEVFVVIHGAGAYSHYMERNFWCGITPPMKMNYDDFRNCITSEVNYQRALVNSYAERSGLPLKNAMTFITNATDRRLGQIKGSEIARILDDPELLNKLGLHLLTSVAQFVQEELPGH
jgi:ornithine decarboxylase